MAVAELERPETAGTETQEPYYSPGRVDYWVSHWPELRELACPTAPAVTYDGHLSQHTPGRRPGDPCRYVDVLADLERAWSRLAIWSIEWTVVDHLMRGHDLGEMARTWRLPFGQVYAAYKDACHTMARSLGWRG